MILDNLSFPSISSERLAYKVSNNIIELYQKQSAKIKSGQAKIIDAQYIPAYQRSHKLEISRYKIENITGKMGILLQAEKAYLQRIKTNDTYLQFTFNPFSLHHELSPKNDKPGKRKITIMQGSQNTKAITKRKFLKERLSNAQQSFNFFKKRINQQKIKTVCKEHNINQIGNANPFPQSNMSIQLLDKIVKRKDKIQFRSNLSNIFKLNSSPFSKQFANCRETLNKYNFCHDSIAHNPQNKQGLTTFRQISLVSRQFITDRHSLISNENRLLSTEILLHLEKLSFQQIMLVSSGMLEQNQLIQSLIENADINQKDADIINLYYINETKKEPFYQPKQRHTQSLFEHQDMDNHLTEKFKNLPLIETQLYQTELSKQSKLKMQSLLAKEKFLTNCGINHQQIRASIQKSKNEIISEQIQKSIDAACKSKRKKVDIDRKIRQFKISKDRSQTISFRFIKYNLDMIKKEQKKTKVTSLSLAGHKNKNSLSPSRQARFQKQINRVNNNLTKQRKISSNQKTLKAIFQKSIKKKYQKKRDIQKTSNIKRY